MRAFRKFFAIIQSHPLLLLVVCLFSSFACYRAGVVLPFCFCLGFAAVISLKHLGFPLLSRPVSNTSVHIGSSPKEIENQLSRPGIFTYSDEAFTVEVPDKILVIRWQDIRALFGYKEDLYTIDRICLDVHHGVDDLLRLSEELSGWHQLQYQLGRHFPGIEWSWQVAIATPAFATNLTLLYEKDGLSLTEACVIYYSSQR